MYNPQDPYQPPNTTPQNPYQQPPSQSPYQQQQPPYYSPNAYPPQQPAGAAAYPPPGATYPPPGSIPYPPQGGYPSPYPYMAGPMSNPRATRAMIYGIISLVLSLLTLTTMIGFSGLITGAFAVIYGFIGLSRAKQLPNNLGRGKAITGIILGFIALIFVVIAIVVQTSRGTYS